MTGDGLLPDPDHVARLVAAAEADPQAAGAWRRAWRASRTYAGGPEGRTLSRELPWQERFDVQRLWVEPALPLASVLLRRERLLEAGPVDPALGPYAAWDLLLRAIGDGRLAAAGGIGAEETRRDDEPPPDPETTRRALLEIHGRTLDRWVDRPALRDAIREQLRPLGVLPTRRGTASVVLLAAAEPAASRAAAEAILAHTRVPFDLSVVLAADHPDDAGWLADLRARHPRVRVQANGRDPGYAKRFDQGLALANGESVAVIEAGHRVTGEWLGRLQWWAEQAPDIGLVAAVPPGAPTGDVRIAPLSCVLLKRGLLDRAGGLDPALGAGAHDADDLCLRAAVAGYRLLAVDDIPVDLAPAGPAASGDPARFRRRWGFDPNPGGAYDVSDRPYDRAAHFVPFGAEEGYRPDARRLVVRPAGARNLLIVPPWDDAAALRALVRAAAAAGPTTDAAWWLRAEPFGGDAARNRLLATARAEGVDPAALPDLVVVDAPLAPDREAGLYVSANAVYVEDAWPEADRTARRAIDCGVPVLRGPEALAAWSGRR